MSNANKKMLGLPEPESEASFSHGMSGRRVLAALCPTRQLAGGWFTQDRRGLSRADDGASNHTEARWAVDMPHSRDHLLISKSRRFLPRTEEYIETWTGNLPNFSLRKGGLCYFLVQRIMCMLATSVTEAWKRLRSVRGGGVVHRGIVATCDAVNVLFQRHVGVERKS